MPTVVLLAYQGDYMAAKRKRKKAAGKKKKWIGPAVAKMKKKGTIGSFTRW